MANAPGATAGSTVEGAHPAPTDPAPTPAPTWTGPGDFGQPAAYDAKTGVAAPLLAGFSLTLLGVVGQAPTSFRWPGAALTALVGVCAVLVACVQCGFRGRALLYSKSDVEAWGRLVPAMSTAEEDQLRATIQSADMRQWRRWHRLTQVTYNAGIMLLFFALALVLAPPRSYGGGVPVPAADAAWRWAGAGLALAASVGELTWVTWEEARLRIRRIRRGRARRPSVDDRPPRRTWRRFLRKESQR